MRGSASVPLTDHWLAPYLDRFPRSGWLLDLGCGPGEDSAVLRERGFQVVSTDSMPRQLAMARGRLGAAALLRVDHRHPLPFRDGVFSGAIASLSLHYMRWEVTLAAFAEMNRVLEAGAPFLFRVNATDDVNFGALEGIEVEPGLRANDESPYSDLKRFFDEPMVRAAASTFTIEVLQHVQIDRYEKPKQVWECLAHAR
ncbi:MAG: class I SAM-dependent methyltransferase [Dehalococcoidia bacterium]|nr:MAG: class I SAM-dependent methyltransferase [Dehalococcoidia bacterium]